MKTNIVVLSTAEKNKVNFAKTLAKLLEMYFIDVKELVEYEISGMIEKLNELGEEYLKNVINNKVKAVSDYEHSVIILPAETIFNNENIYLFKKSSIILNVKLNESTHKKVTDIALDERQKMYAEIADINLDYRGITISQAVKQTLKVLCSE